MQYKILFSAAILAMLVMIGCNSGDSEPYKTTKSVSGRVRPDRPKFPVQPIVADAPAIGTMAPGIAGLDTDGSEFRLSDYKGKIVMLDFWGDW